MRRTTACILAMTLAGSMFSLDVSGASETPVSRLFDPDGGTLVATATDGTQFVLTVPPDALVLPMVITMTPLTNRRPEDGRTFVRIAPEGAFLWRPAQLEIVPATPADVKNLRYFRIGGPDQDFTFYPGLPDPTVIAMEISYLATYGVEAGGMPGMSPQRHPSVEPAVVRSIRLFDVTSSALSPYVARQAAFFWQMVNQELDSDAYLQAVYAIYDEAWAQVVSPALDSLGTECDLNALTSVFQLAFEFLHMDERSAPRYDLYDTAVFGAAKQQLVQCIDLFYQRCKDNYDPTQVSFIFQLERQLSLIQLSEGELADIHQKIHDCLRFEVDFESTLSPGTSSGGGSVTYHLTLRATVPVELQFVPVGFFLRELLTGSAVLSYASVSVVPTPPCTTQPTTANGTFDVFRLNVGLFGDGALSNDEIQLDMIYDFPESPTTVAFALTCPAGPLGNVTVQFPPDPVFPTFYGFLHQDELMDYRVAGVYRIKSPPQEAGAVRFAPGGDVAPSGRYYWQVIRSGNLFAKAQYLRTIVFPGLGPIPEATIILLKHTPL